MQRSVIKVLSLTQVLTKAFGRNQWGQTRLIIHLRSIESDPIDSDTTTICWSGYQLLGIYSGRINNDSDIGVVWKKEVICELLDAIEP